MSKKIYYWPLKDSFKQLDFSYSVSCEAYTIPFIIGAALTAVCQWKTVYQRHGPDAIKPTPHAVRPAILIADQSEQLEKFLLQGSETYGYTNALWTLSQAAAVIKSASVLGTIPPGPGISWFGWAGVARNRNARFSNATKKPLPHGEKRSTVYKKTHRKVVKPLFLWTKAALCSNRWSAVLGHREDKHRFTIAGTDVIGCRLSRYFLSYRFADGWAFILTCLAIMLRPTMQLRLLKPGWSTFPKELSWSGIAGWFIAVPASDWRDDSESVSPLNGFWPMLLSLLLSSRYGTEPSMPIWPTLFHRMFGIFAEPFVSRSEKVGSQQSLLRSFFKYTLQSLSNIKWFFQKSVNNHQLKPVTLPYSGFACPPLAAVSIHQSYWWY